MNEAKMKTSEAEAPSEGSGPKVDNQQKDPSQWVTGNEPMTGAQASYLKTLCEESGEAFDASISKAEASRRIDAMRSRPRAG